MTKEAFRQWEFVEQWMFALSRLAGDACEKKYNAYLDAKSRTTHHDPEDKVLPRFDQRREPDTTVYRPERGRHRRFRYAGDYESMDYWFYRGMKKAMVYTSRSHPSWGL